MVTTTFLSLSLSDDQGSPQEVEGGLALSSSRHPRLILATFSTVFKAMFYGPMRETKGVSRYSYSSSSNDNIVAGDCSEDESIEDEDESESVEDSNVDFSRPLIKFEDPEVGGLGCLALSSSLPPRQSRWWYEVSRLYIGQPSYTIMFQEKASDLTLVCCDDEVKVQARRGARYQVQREVG